MKVTQNTIKNARSGNTFWRVLVGYSPFEGRIVATSQRIDLNGKKVFKSFESTNDISVKIGDDLRGHYLDDVAGWSECVQTFTQEKQAKNFVFEIENMPHLHPEAINAALENYDENQLWSHFSEEDFDFA